MYKKLIFFQHLLNLKLNLKIDNKRENFTKVYTDRKSFMKIIKSFYNFSLIKVLVIFIKTFITTIK